MTVSNITNKVTEQGNGSKVVYTFDFKVFLSTDLQVFKVDRDSLIEALQVEGTDYTVVLNTITEGGTVTYVTAPTTSEDSLIKRVVVLDQQTNVPTEGNLPESSLNNEYDKQVMIDIQQQEQLDRSIHFPEASALTDIEAPEGTSAADRATKIWGWSADGLSLTLYAATIVDAVSVIAVQGDIVQGDSVGVAEKLSIGGAGGLLHVVSGKLAYLSLGNLGQGLIVTGGNTAWGTPAIKNYRSGFNCKWTSTTSITISAGLIEVAGVMVNAAVDTVLDITSAGDWVDNTSEQAVSTYGYVYVNAAGNIELDDVAPDESDISGNTSGILRYNDTGTDTSDRRMVGWFYMNATGAGELSIYEVGNLKDGDAQNSVVRTNSTQDAVNDTTYASDLTNTEVHFYSSGRGVTNIACQMLGTGSGASQELNAILSDGSDVVPSEDGVFSGAGGFNIGLAPKHAEAYAQGGVTFLARAKVSGGTWTVEEKTMMISED